ncbi:MAG: phosphatidate cytidylyltransferase, partial [Eubacterium sp.]|nr:phosphatidate cytidylyltransferase [Eubacterium sp.]
MFWTRLASGTVLVILFIGILWVGGWLTCWSMCLLSLIGVFELMRVYKLEKSALAILAYLATIVYYTMLFIGKTDLLMP